MASLKTNEKLSDKALAQVTGGAANNIGTDEVHIKILSLLKNRLDLNDISINSNSSIVSDLGADSLDVVDIIQALETEFHIGLPESRISSVHTVEELCNLVRESLNL